MQDRARRQRGEADGLCLHRSGEQRGTECESDFAEHEPSS